jgi:hypothetical protein
MASMDRMRTVHEADLTGQAGAGDPPRAENSVADALASATIDRVAAGGPPSVVARP